MPSIYDIPLTSIDGQTLTMDAYRGQVLLVVNVASQCRFTGQYQELEALYRRFHDKGFVVLGFPCDQFLHQEPAAEPEIKEFCATAYGVTFPLFAKTRVNGAAAHPLYKLLKSSQSGLLGTRFIKWNFTKFLVDRHGAVVNRYAPTAHAQAIARDVAPLVESAATVPGCRQ